MSVPGQLKQPGPVPLDELFQEVEVPQELQKLQTQEGIKTLEDLYGENLRLGSPVDINDLLGIPPEKSAWEKVKGAATGIGQAVVGLFPEEQESKLAPAASPQIPGELNEEQLKLLRQINRARWLKGEPVTTRDGRTFDPTGVKSISIAIMNGQMSMQDADDFGAFPEQEDPFTLKGALGILKNLVFGKTPGTLPGAPFVSEIFEKPKPIIPEPVGKFLPEAVRNANSFLPLRTYMSDEPPGEYMSQFLDNSESGRVAKAGLWYISRGIASVVESMSTPENLGIILASSYTGGGMGKITSAIFGADMLAHMPDVAEQFVAAVESGDIDQAIEVGTVGVLTGAMVYGLGKHTFSADATIAPEAKPFVDRLEKALQDPEKAKGIHEALTRLDELQKRIRERQELFERTKALEEQKQQPPFEEGGRLITPVRAPRPEDLVAVQRGPEPTPTFRIIDPTKGEPAKLIVPGETPADGVAVTKEQLSNLPTPPIDVRIIQPTVGFETKTKTPFLDLLREFSEISLKKVDPTEVVKPRPGKPKTEIVILGKESTIVKKNLQNFEKALLFLEEKYPTLLSKVGRVYFATKQAMLKVGVSSANAYVVPTGAHEIGWYPNHPEGKPAIVVGSNFTLDVSHPEALTRSPQLMTGKEIAETLRPGVVPERQRYPTVLNYVQTLAEELQHASDILTFEHNWPLLVGTSSPKQFAEALGAERSGVPVKLVKLSYWDQLMEKRGRSRMRGADKLWRREFGDATNDLTQALGLDRPSKVTPFGDNPGIIGSIRSFTEEDWYKIKPEFIRTWRLARDAGVSYSDFSTEMTKRFGNSIEEYLREYEKEMSVYNTNPSTNTDKSPVVGEESETSTVPISDESVLAAKAAGRSWAQRVQDVFSVEARYRRIGSPNTGKAVKGVYGVQAMYEEKAFQTVRQILRILRQGGKGDYKSDVSNIVLTAESNKMRSALDPTKPRDKRMIDALAVMDKFFKDGQETLRSYGVKVDFKERLSAEIRTKIAEGRLKGENTKDLWIALKKLKDVQYVHIPIALWFEKTLSTDPMKFKKVIDIVSAKKRETVRISDLISAGVLKPEDIHIVDVIANYGRRLGKDVSMLRIIDAAKGEGLAKDYVKGTPLETGFSLPPARAKALKGFQVRTELKEWLVDALEYRPVLGRVGKVISAVKMNQFYNPLFLPMYDIYQAAFAGTVTWHMVGGTVGFATGGVPGFVVGSAIGEALSRGILTRGLWHAMKKTDLYYALLENGIASTPFPNTFKSFADTVEGLKRSRTVRAVEFLTDFPGVLAVKRLARGERAMKVLTGLLPAQMMNDVYSMSFNLAWLLDRGIRISTAIHLMRYDKMSISEAAQVSALFHGDYASVPIKTRTTLNKVFFTPTFKIAMGKLFTNMVQGAAKTVFTPGKATPKDVRLAKGLVYLGAALIAFDLVMRGQGFIPDEWGVRYRRRVSDSEEGEKDLIVVFANPANLVLKYLERIQSVFKGYKETPGLDLLRRFKWEITPLYRIAYNTLSNRDDAGDMIYSPLDKSEARALKAFRYAFVQSYTMLGLLEDKYEQKQVREKFAKETNQLFELALRPFVGTYVRSTAMRSAIRKVNELRETYNRLILDGKIKGDEAYDQAVRMDKYIQEILEDATREEAESRQE